MSYEQTCKLQCRRREDSTSSGIGLTFKQPCINRGKNSIFKAQKHKTKHNQAFQKLLAKQFKV